MLHQVLVACAHGRNFLVYARIELFFGSSPANALRKFLGKSGGFLGAGKGLVNLKQGRAFGILGFARRARIGLDVGDQFLQLRAAGKQRDGVVIALAHLAAIQARQGGHAFFDGRLRRYKMFAIAVVKTVRHVARHFDVLHLIAPHRHMVGVEHQNVCTHQHGVHKQASAHVRVRVGTGCGVFVHRGFVGMRAVEDAFAGHAGQKPGEFGDFGDVGLAVEHHALGVQARR